MKQKNKPTLEELSKKYDNIILLKDLKTKKIPLIGEANCTK